MAGIPRGVGRCDGRLLNGGVLPPGYYAVPFVDRAGPVEIDVGALQESDDVPAGAGYRAWLPEAPALTVTIDPPAVDSVRVDVLTGDGNPRLAAAVELASPRNKGRPSARQSFAAKCAGVLLDGGGLVVVDAVTTRRGELHAAILAVFGAADVSNSPPGPSAVAYRASHNNDGSDVRAWPTTLTVGLPLPTLPLWLAPDLAVPLDLEASHAAACADVCIGRPANGGSPGHVLSSPPATK